MRNTGWLTLTLAVGLALSARAAEAPRTLASVWLNSRGEGTMPDGRIYRLQDEHGMPYILARKAALVVMDTKP